MLNFDEWLTNYTLSGFLLVSVFALCYFRAKINNEGLFEPVDWRWGAAFFGILFLMRYPFIAYNHELDIDESQMLVQALSLKKFWIYWKYVDGLTQGPLTSYLLIVPSWLGMPFDYTSARLLGFVVLCLTLSATFLTFRNLFKKPVAVIIFTPVAFFYLLSQGSFSSLYNEYLVLCLLALCFWFFSLLYRQPQPNVGLLFLLGFVSGMVPFAKLQGVPIALVIVMFEGLIILRRSPQKVRALASLSMGGLLVPLVVLYFTMRYEAFDYFWNFYVIGNMEYSSGGTIWQKALQYPKFLRQSGQFFHLLICYVSLIICSLWLLIRSGTMLKSVNLLFGLGFFLIVTAFYVIIKSGYLFPHYQQFMIIPLGIFSGVVLEAALPTIKWDPGKIRPAALAWMLVCLLPHVVNKLATVTGHASLPGVQISKGELGKPLSISPVSRRLLELTLPGDHITIWGWHPAYHLETKLPQGTADVVPFRLLTSGPQQKNYQEKYLHDLKINHPAVFIDLITNQSFWFNDPGRYAHEQIAGIRHFIAQNYLLVSTINGERIFVRKDRL
jgi:hypothetical protein